MNDDSFLSYIQQATEAVEAWNLPEDQVIDAINQQALLMAGDISIDSFLTSITNS